MPLASRANRIKSTRAEAVIDRSVKGGVSGRLKRALDAMVWGGLPRAQAAEKANISEHGLWDALRKAHVREYYKQQLDVLRLSTHARNIHVLEEIRDSTKNHMARVQAIKALEQLCDDLPTPGGSYQVPGLTIRIVGATQQQPMIDVTPTTERENAEGT
jgi:hypothetical protein